MRSIYQNLGGVIDMPEFQARNLYMHKMQMDEVSLPKEFKDFEEAIYLTLSKVENKNNVCYITIDEKHIKNDTHRRGGVHCDFNWYENILSHAGDGPIATHSDRLTLQGKHGEPIPSHSNRLHQLSGQHGGSTHKFTDDEILGGMLLVSNYEGCKVWKGEINGNIGNGGDCSSINLENLDNEIMPAGYVYFLNALGIHESIKIEGECQRSLIRINFHPNYQFIK